MPQQGAVGIMDKLDGDFAYHKSYGFDLNRWILHCDTADHQENRDYDQSNHGMVYCNYKLCPSHDDNEEMDLVSCHF